MTTTATADRAAPRRFGLLLLGLLLPAPLLLAACSGSPDEVSPALPTAPQAGPATTLPGRTDDRLVVVAQIVDEVVAPLLRSADAAIGAARDATEAYCGAPSPSTLDGARHAVDAGIAAFERLDVVDMGPIMLNRTESHVAYPVDAERVRELLAAGAPTDVFVVNDRLPASTRGLTTAEHLLGSDPAPATDATWCGFLVAVATDAADEMATVVTDSFDGSRGNPPYLNQLTGDANVAEEPQDTINVIVNMMMDVLDVDAGSLTDPGADPASVRRAVSAHLATVDAVWGDGTTGLSRLVDPELTGRLAAEIARARGLADDGSSTGPELQAAVDEVRATIGTEVVAALDVVVGFSDNDGDS